MYSEDFEMNIKKDTLISLVKGGVNLWHIFDENHILWTNVPKYYPILITI